MITLTASRCSHVANDDSPRNVRELLPDAHEHVLRQLIGRLRPRHSPGEVVHPTQMGLVNALESARIPLSSKGDVVHQH